VSLRTLWRRFRKPSEQEVQEIRDFRATALPAVRRAQGHLDRWLKTRDEEPDNEQLANAASVHRWELARLTQEVRQQTPPPRAQALHAELAACLDDYSRAFHLLGTGERYNRSDTVCDGQALLVDTGTRLQRLEKLLGED
jgi:hypothetical protein